MLLKIHLNRNKKSFIRMTNYKQINRITGLVVFAIAAIVYLLTIEPTASFWDCGEFITSAFKLEVGHPPGAPIFMLVGNLFTQFASNLSQVAKMVNIMSALLSAFTILFLFWTITHLTKKLVLKNDEQTITFAQTLIVIGSGLVGALTYTFSDTFWYSAVEGEVYAFSSMLTALVFWLILKWEENADKPHSEKWLVLIAYIMGLSIGVHLLNLLCIPAIALVYYFRKSKETSWKGVLNAILISFGLILILMYGIIPGFTKVGGWFELFFVNTLGLSYNSGVLVYFIILTASIAWTLYETFKENINFKRAKLAFITSLALSGILFIGSSIWLWVLIIVVAAYFIFRKENTNIKLINLASSCLLVILIGFSAYLLIPIRSSANPPLDLNSPEDVFSLGSYLNREQYGDTPLIYGQTYASQIERDGNGTAIYKTKKQYERAVKTSADQKDKYIVKDAVDSYKFNNTMLFPRMHSGEDIHFRGYKDWAGVTDKNKQPTLAQNIKFLFNYQLNYMYWRYFFWNFSGRQNDIQGDGGMTKGNWITGIPFIDNKVLGLGPQDEIAPDVSDNKGRNVYFMLPFILGIIGLVYQLNLKKKGRRNFLIVFTLFFMTGIAIVLYLNQKPFEPRERDYAYAGSFYAFAIWIGIGVAGVGKFLRKYIKNTKVSAIAATLLCMVVPVLMGTQNWDDHDRSNRTLARDMGMNYLSCVEPNGIIFTNGDNDTYPLWYAQEVEGYRTDVRVSNLQFLNTQWYIDQMKRSAYESSPLPIEWSRAQYWAESAAPVYIITKQQIESALKKSNIPSISYSQYYDAASFKDTISLKETLEKLKTNTSYAANPFIENVAIIPGSTLVAPIDTSKVDWKSLNSKPTDKFVYNLNNKQAIFLQELMLLEMLKTVNNDNWERPIYFATTVDRSLYVNLMDQLSLVGLTYRVVPGEPLEEGINTEIAFDNMVNKFRWGGLDTNPDIYVDETGRRMVSTVRLFFTQLIDKLIEEGKNDKALLALDKCTGSLPGSIVPYSTDGVILARNYFQIGENKKGKALIESIEDRILKNLSWYDRLKPQQMANTSSDIVYDNLNPLLMINSVYQRFDKKKYNTRSQELLQRAQTYYMQGLPFMGDIILKELTNSAIMGYQSLTASSSTPAPNTDDTTKITLEAEIMGSALKMMQQYSPELFQQYSQTANK